MKKLATLILFFACPLLSRSQDANGFFFDERDGQEYETIFIEVEQDGVSSTLEWMSSNLNYEVDGSKCYKNYPEYCNSFGRLYSWTIAREVCPEGWHISLGIEWKLLMAKYGSKTQAGPSLIEGGESNLNLQPAGFGEKSGEFIDVGVNGYYWKKDTRSSIDPGTITVHRGVDYVTDDEVDETHYNSVRCVRDY